METIFYLAVLIISVILHEVAHGAVAEYFGDQTAKRLGRLTLNPISHIDPVGSVLVPLMLSIAGAPVFGWAKPVPVDERNLRNPVRSMAIVAAAGPITNLILALLSSVVFRIVGDTNLVFSQFLFGIVIVNIGLAIFNLVPIPPLDGSRLVRAILTGRARVFWERLEGYGFFLVAFFIFFLPDFISPIIFSVVKLFLGI
jgi:Zn-dependent protease